jgi:type IV pilus assembly protein PilY1
MKRTLREKWSLALIGSALVCTALPSSADDIDIFVGTSGGRADAPNIIFLIDNSPNWSRSSQKWPDNGGTQGAAELAALSSALNSITPGQPINVGLAMLNEVSSGGGGGGYIRFAARDMSVAANRTALQNILSYISANINSPSEKVGGMASKDEAAGLYEVYKYFSGMPPFTGSLAKNPEADVSGNTAPYSAAGQGLTTGFAIQNGQYQTPINSSQPCAKNFVIYISNNANNTGSAGLAAYEPLVANAAPGLPPTILDNWTDEWTRFLYRNGVVTYVLDAYNAQQNTGYSNALMRAANAGGGSYFQVGSQTAITAALATIFAEIQGVNSTFASASLPVNTTNRSQDKNQVFIPMFRPDPSAHPRWMGNLKQYQLINTGAGVQLGDAAGNPAVNPLTGFPTDCATSYWTSDSGTYWANIIETPLPKGTCPTATTTFDPYSDAPDGPFVEKGGVAEVIRKGNNPSSTTTVPTWLVNRTVYTKSGTGLAAFTTASSGLSAQVVNFVLGQDVNDENGNGNLTEVRASVHGDAIHSRPVPVDYGGSTGVTTYYGSNDGTLRAVDAAKGNERWAFIAPEFFPTLSRLMTNSPLINYPSMPTGVTPTPARKDYYFDGSIGLYQTADNSKVWIYPTMRRGGRMLYALNVTSPNSPTFKWSVGCPNLSNDDGCTAGLAGIGQTWSMPSVVATISGYSGPVVIVGGGYDGCEDQNTATPSCAKPKGAGVYVFDADTGALIKSFSTTRSVAADVALVAVTTAGIVDHGYAVDTGGSVYRIDFGGSPSAWVMNRVAYTDGSGRKFLFAPAVLPAPGNQVYLALGSGDREHPLQSQYPYNGVTNRFYVFRDDLTTTGLINLDDASTMNDYTSATTCSTAGTLPSSTAKGWFMNLTQYGVGEQTVTSAIISAGMVAFSTNRPVPAATGSCATTLGEARGYWVNLFNGSGAIGQSRACGGNRSSIFVGGGLPPSPMSGIVSIGGTPTAVVIGAAQRDGGASTPIGAQEIKPPIIMKRKTRYWKSSIGN